MPTISHNHTHHERKVLAIHMRHGHDIEDIGAFPCSIDAEVEPIPIARFGDFRRISKSCEGFFAFDDSPGQTGKAKSKCICYKPTKSKTMSVIFSRVKMNLHKSAD